MPGERPLGIGEFASHRGSRHAGRHRVGRSRCPRAVGPAPVEGTSDAPKSARTRRATHKTAEVLDPLPTSARPAAKRALQEIYDVEDKEHAATATAAFAQPYGAKYSKVVKRPTDNQEEQLRSSTSPQKTGSTEEAGATGACPGQSDV
ncbi:transposase [Streptomyces sp. NBC_01317]|uniref:transposase n=1 Tax=Streptomyces sp. NBC_01317 TaxID=2903822 RepID=UPI002E1617E1|nr:transposase [Streptomyces sp. NBC_01317]